MAPPPPEPTRAYRLVDSRIPLTAERRRELSAYAVRHYGAPLTLLRPRAVVLHFTGSDDAAGTLALFARNAPVNGEYPQVCSHFVVAQDGTVHLVVDPWLPCRHTIGLNHVAIGVEFAQGMHGHDSRWADGQILRRRAQVEAGLALVRELQRTYAIPTSAVIGHAGANSFPLFRDLTGARNDHTDWLPEDVAAFRSRL